MKQNNSDKKNKYIRFPSNILYAVFAVLLSVFLWLFVEITENEVQIMEISNIEVILRNEEILSDRGLIIAEIETETISITFEGSRSDLTALALPGALTAEVDLAAITSAGGTSLTYEIIYPIAVNPNSVSILGRSVTRIGLRIDRMLERVVPVRVDYTGGTASELLIAEPAEFNPTTISIRGPEDIVSLISYVRVPIFRENLSTTYTEELGFVLYDDYDEQIILDESVLEHIHFSHDTIMVTVPIREIREIPLTVELSHDSSTSSANTRVVISPSTIRVSGDPEVLRDINNILLGTIDMSRFGLTTFEEFTIVAPNNVTNISGELTAAVMVEVLGLETQFRNVTNLQVVNVPEGLSYEILTQTLAVMIRGSAAELSHVLPVNIFVVADLSDVNPGTSWLPARVYLSGIDARVDAVGEYRMAVSITDES